MGSRLMAQLRWQKPANGSDAVAMARIRWQRTLDFATFAWTGQFSTFLVSDLDRAVLSGSGGALPRRRPLRTGRARFPGSSAQASPDGSGPGSAGLVSPPRRRQWACMRWCAARSSGVPRSITLVIACLRIAVRVAVCHCCHSSGPCGRWSACRSSPRQSGHRPRWRRSRCQVAVSTGRRARRRRWSQYPVQAGSSGTPARRPCGAGRSWSRRTCGRKSALWVWRQAPAANSTVLSRLAI